MAKPELKAECIRLRKEERLSIREIHKRTGASKGSLSAWLRPFPLAQKERVTKHQAANQRRKTMAAKKKKAEKKKGPKLLRARIDQLPPDPGLEELLRGKRNTRKQGDVGLATAIAYFGRRGYTVCVPLTDNQDYDLVVETEAALKKVSVKTTYSRSEYGVYTVTLAVSGGNRSGTSIKLFDPKRADLLFVQTECDELFLIPANRITAKRTISLGEKYKKYRVTL